MLPSPDEWRARRLAAGTIVLALAAAAGLVSCAGKVCECGPALGISVTGTGSTFLGLGSSHSYKIILAGDLTATVSCAASWGTTGGCSAPSSIAGSVLSNGDLKLEVSARPTQLEVTVVVDGVIVRVAHLAPNYADGALACGSDCPRADEGISATGP